MFLLKFKNMFYVFIYLQVNVLTHVSFLERMLVQQRKITLTVFVLSEIFWVFQHWQ